MASQTSMNDPLNRRLPDAYSRWSEEDKAFFRELLRKAASRGSTEAWPRQEHKPLEEFIREISSIAMRNGVDENGMGTIRDAIIEAWHIGYEKNPRTRRGF